MYRLRVCLATHRIFFLEIIIVRGTSAARPRQKISVSIIGKNLPHKYRRYSIGIAIDADTNNPAIVGIAVLPPAPSAACPFWY